MRFLLLRLTAATLAVALAGILAANVVLDQVDEYARARAQAEADLAALVTLAEATVDEAVLLRGIGRSPSGRAGRLALYLPDRTIGTSRSSTRGTSSVEGGYVRGDVRTDIRTDGGWILRRAVPAAPVPGVVAEVFLPDVGPSLPDAGVALVLVGAALLGAAGGLAAAWRPFRAAVADIALLTRAIHHLDRRSAPDPQYMRTPESAALAQALAAAVVRFEEAHDRERRIAADLSHRLRTPLTALALDAGAIGNGPAAERMRATIATLDEEIDALIRVIPVHESRPAQCDLVTVVEQRIAFWSALSQHTGRPHEVRVDRPSAEIALAADDMAAVIDALLGNIFQYTSSGTAWAVSVVGHAGWTSLVVDDAGPGVADPVTALRRGVSTGGSTGLGLDIARDAVEAAGGTIHIEHAALGGARIRLRFPDLISDVTPADTA